MSRIAAMILAAAKPAAAAPPMTAEQVIVRHRAATSIGPDPRRVAVGDEIVVCAQRESPYSLPLYDPMAGQDASQSGGGRARQMAEMEATFSPCAMQGLGCQPQATVNVLSVLPFVIKGVNALIDDE